MAEPVQLSIPGVPVNTSVLGVESAAVATISMRGRLNKIAYLVAAAQ